MTNPLKTTSKLREKTYFSEEDYTKILQQKYRLENQLQEADNKAYLAEEEAFKHKEETKKLSKKITSLTTLLNNTHASKEALERHISDKAVLESNSSTSSNLVSAAKPMTKKELKKLRQKTKKRLENMQAKESDDINGGDDNLNNSVSLLTASLSSSGILGLRNIYRYEIRVPCKVAQAGIRIYSYYWS